MSPFVNWQQVGTIIDSQVTHHFHYHYQHHLSFCPQKMHAKQYHLLSSHRVRNWCNLKLLITIFSCMSLPAITTGKGVISSITQSMSCPRFWTSNHGRTIVHALKGWFMETLSGCSMPVKLPGTQPFPHFLLFHAFGKMSSKPVNNQHGLPS